MSKISRQIQTSVTLVFFQNYKAANDKADYVKKCATSEEFSKLGINETDVWSLVLKGAIATQDSQEVEGILSRFQKDAKVSPAELLTAVDNLFTAPITAALVFHDPQILSLITKYIESYPYNYEKVDLDASMLKSLDSIFHANLDDGNPNTLAGYLMYVRSVYSDITQLEASLSGVVDDA